MTSPPDLTAIVVAFDSGAELAASIESIRREAAREGLAAQILVVDNASKDGAAASLPSSDDTTVLTNRRNVGFGAAVNRGFRAAEGRRVLLLNPDARLSPGALRPLLDALEDDPTVALAAPSLRLGDGSAQESPRRFYDLGAVLGRRTPLRHLAGPRRAAEQHLIDSAALPGPTDVDWVTGAAMLLDRDAMPGDGPFDERFFLYFEDVDLCRRLHATGRTVRFVPDAVVDHRFGGASRRQVPWNPLLWSHIRSGVLYSFRWSEGWWSSRWWRTAASGAAAFGLRLALFASLLTVLLPTGPALAAGAVGSAVVERPRRRRLGRTALPTGLGTFGRLAIVAVAAHTATTGSVSTDAVAPLLWWAVAAAASLDLLRRLRRASGGALRRRGFGHTTCLLAGDPTAAAAIAQSLAESPQEGLEIAGFVPLDPFAEGGPTPRLRSWEHVADVARDLRAEAVLIAGTADDLARTADGVDALRRAGVEASFALTGSTELLQPTDSDRVGAYPLLPLGIGAAARISDRLAAGAGRCAAALGLLLLLPVTPLLLLASAVASRRAPVHGVGRVGRELRPFRMLRLRTAPEGEDGGGRLGSLLRRTHIDELPQLWNVVRGEMALVGPRPVEPEVAEQLEPWERARFRVRPGITGMWQLDRLRRWRLEQMVASDLLYLLRWSPSLDLRILGETLLGRRTP
ncbi:MAG: glycosyltransferase [Proteobacteria bacterium]|nr:glycosyltransferase [Pseudomonadota bacterium]